LRYLASTFLAGPDPDPVFGVRHQPRRNIARTNAAVANARLQQRRHERDDVDAYLQSRLLPHSTVNAAADPAGHETRRAL
jgi:hypothetical protein